MHQDSIEEWRLLHGYVPGEPAARLCLDSAGELAGYRAPDFLAGPNVVEAAIEASRGTHRLNLWEMFVSVLPSVALGNGDVLHVYVPSPLYPAESAAIVVWNHERDHFYGASPEDLREVGQPGPVGDPAKALMFCDRSAYLVELLARGRFDLDAYLGFGHVPLAVDHPAFFDNLAASPPTGTYALWHLFFTGHARIDRAIEAGARSGSRWTRDSAALIAELLAGRNQLGPIDDVRVVRAEITALVADPATLATAANAQRRRQVERQVANVRPAVLTRDDAPGEPVDGEVAARFGDLDLQVDVGVHQRARLVLRREGRVLDALPLRGVGGASDSEASFHVVQSAPIPLVLIWRRADATSTQHPWDGTAAFYAIASNRLMLVAAYSFDLQGIERRDGHVIARTLSGAGYRCARLDRACPETAAPATLPGIAIAPPAASPPHEIGDDRLELTPTSLQVWRKKKLLFEVPLTEAYAMTVLPARRLVAIHGADANLRPTVDVLYVKQVSRAVKPDNGCCSWVCFPVPGLDVQLASTDDRLFVHDGTDWIEIDEEPLATVPSWIRSRGWVS